MDRFRDRDRFPECAVGSWPRLVIIRWTTRRELQRSSPGNFPIRTISGVRPLVASCPGKGPSIEHLVEPDGDHIKTDLLIGRNMSVSSPSMAWSTGFNAATMARRWSSGIIGWGLCFTFASRATITNSSSPIFLILPVEEVARVEEVKGARCNNTAVGHATTSSSWGSPPAVKHRQSVFLYGYR